jgi:hypothetical protein
MNHDTAWALNVTQWSLWDEEPVHGIVESAEGQGQHCRIVQQAHHEIRGETVGQRLSGFGQLPQYAESGVTHSWAYLPATNRSALTLDLIRA